MPRRSARTWTRKDVDAANRITELKRAKKEGEDSADRIFGEGDPFDPMFEEFSATDDNAECGGNNKS